MKIENSVNLLLLDLIKHFLTIETVEYGRQEFSLKMYWMSFDYNSLESQKLNHMLVNRNTDHSKDIVNKNSVAILSPATC